MFARLGELQGTRVLDLYAGSGALGVEALSRGADSVVFVERAAATLAVLRGNVTALGLSAEARVIGDDVVRAVRRLGRSGERFDLVLLDPPYASDEAARALEALVDSGALAEGAVVVVEHSRRHPLPGATGLALLDERRYGDTAITRLTANLRPRGSGGSETG